MTEIWDNVWENRKKISDYSLHYYNFMKNFGNSLPEGAKVLEAGCGSGDTLAAFKKQETYGLDLSKKSLALAKKNAKHTVLGDIFKMPFKDNTFDLVYNSGVLEHFPEPNNLKATKEMARITKKGGYVIIILPNKYCFWYRAVKIATIKITGKWEFGYEEEYSLPRLKNLVQRAGLKIEKTFGLTVLPPFATNRIEILPLSVRKHLIHLDKLFPFREYYAFGTGVICKKVA